jgi:hypothetical protein
VIPALRVILLWGSTISLYLFFSLQQYFIFFPVYFSKYKGEYMAHNKDLADVQGVSELHRDVIDKLHTLRYLIENNVKELMISRKSVGSDKLEELIQTNYRIWMENEKLLQKLWKFKEDEGYIRTWNFPACSCPKMDNEDAWPYGPYIKSQSCIVHGWEE